MNKKNFFCSLPPRLAQKRFFEPWNFGRPVISSPLDRALPSRRHLCLAPNQWWVTTPRKGTVSLPSTKTNENGSSCSRLCLPSSNSACLWLEFMDYLAQSQILVWAFFKGMTSFSTVIDVTENDTYRPSKAKARHTKSCGISLVSIYFRHLQSFKTATYRYLRKKDWLWATQIYIWQMTYIVCITLSELACLLTDDNWPSSPVFSSIITGRCWKRLIGQPWHGAAVAISWCCCGTYCMVEVHQTLLNTSQSLSLIAVTLLWETPAQLKRHFAEQATVQAASCLRLLHYLTLSLCLSYLAHLVLCSLPNSINISHMTSLLLALHNLFLTFTFIYLFYFIFHIFLPILQRKALTLAFLAIWQSFSKIYIYYYIIFPCVALSLSLSLSLSLFLSLSSLSLSLSLSLYPLVTHLFFGALDV